jgi:hypothetical protein
MRLALLSLTWEIWRKNRACHAILLALLGTGVAARLYADMWLTHGRILPGTGRLISSLENPRVHFILGDVLPNLAWAAMWLTVLTLIVIFSCADSGVPLGYPRRSFTLPISTAALANGPIFLGAIAIVLFHAAWHALFLIPDYPFGGLTLFFITALVAFQASVWCLSGRPTLLVIVLALLVPLLLRLAYLTFVEQGQLLPILYLTVLLGTSYAAAWIGLARRRHCDDTGIGSEEFPFQKARLRPTVAHQILKHPQQALRWMENRRNLAAPAAVLIVVIAIFAIFQTRLRDAGDFAAGALGTIWIFFFSSAITFWAALSGLLAASDPSSGSLALSQFAATRPCACGELLASKLKLYGLLWVIGAVIYGAGVLLWLRELHLHQRPPRADEIVAILFTACGLAWHLTGALPVWLAGRIPGVSIAGLLLIGGYIAIGNVVSFFVQRFGIWKDRLVTLLVLALAAKLLVAAWASWRARKLRLVTRGFVAACGAIWLVATLCFVAAAVAFCPETEIPRPLAALLASVLFPLARVALAPLALASARHR